MSAILLGAIRQCYNCECRVMFTGLGWVHVDIRGLRPCNMPKPDEVILKGKCQKHNLRFERVSNKGKRLVFRCQGCGKDRIYIRNRVHLLLTNAKTKYVKKDRSN